MHDPPSVLCTADTPARIASTSSAQSTSSSNVLFSTSTHSSRNANSPIVDAQKTPVKHRRGQGLGQGRRKSPPRRRKSTSSRDHSGDVTAQTNADFFKKLLHPENHEASCMNHEAAVFPVMPQTPSKPPPPLLPPIELQPPSPPHTRTQPEQADPMFRYCDDFLRDRQIFTSPIFTRIYLSQW